MMPEGDDEREEGAERDDVDDLLERARQGDRNALEELLRRNQERFERAAHRMLGDGLRTRVRTSDILQSTYVKVVSTVQNFRGTTEDAFAHWVARIIENSIRDTAKYHNAGKRAKNKEAAGAEIEQLELMDTGPTPSREAVLSEQLFLTGKALCRLPDDYRRVILLIMPPGATHRDVARELKRSPGASRVLLSRARAALAIEMDRLMKASDGG